MSGSLVLEINLGLAAQFGIDPRKPVGSRAAVGLGGWRWHRITDERGEN